MDCINHGGYVHSIYSGGMVDGPGIRTVVFFAGCPLRCKYCHNPDTWQFRSGHLMSVDALLDEVNKYKSFYTFSGGGVTISGGEPFAQPEFLLKVLTACKQQGIHTAIDTSGFTTPEWGEKVLAKTDLLLLDFKAFYPETYKKVTGLIIDKMFYTLEIAHRMNVKTWIRFVLVPGLTDDLEEIRYMADYLKSYDNIEKIQVLPFHKTGEYKWDDVDVPYTLHDTEPPEIELLTQVREILEK